MKKKLVFVSKLLLLALSLCLLWQLVDPQTVLTCVSSIPVSALVLLILLNLLKIWLDSVRWQWAHPHKSRQLSSWHYFRLMMISQPFSLMMPGAFGGDLVRTTMTLSAVEGNRANHLIAIVTDRLIGLFSIIALGSLALLFTNDVPNKSVFYGFFGVLIGGFSILFLMFSSTRSLRLIELILAQLGTMGSRLRSLLEAWKEALLFFKYNRKSLLKALLLCLPIHGLSFFTGYLIARILGMGISFFDISIVLALTWVITAIPITISGLGIRELSLIYLLSFYGVTTESATALSVCLYIISLIIGLIGLILFFITTAPMRLLANNNEFSAKNTL